MPATPEILGRSQPVDSASKGKSSILHLGTDAVRLRTRAEIPCQKSSLLILIIQISSFMREAQQYKNRKAVIRSFKRR